MSKKFIIILISSVLGLLLVSLMGYYFIIQDGNANGTGGGINFRSFLPFGGEQEIPEDTGTGSENEEENTTPTPEENSTDFTQKLRKLSVEPVAGAGVLDITAGTLVRYIERATGHIYEVELYSPKKERR